MENRKRTRVLLGCTGSVASIKVPELVKQMKNHGADVRVVATEHAKHFFRAEDLGGTQVLCDADEWDSWHQRGDPVLHIELRKWADLLIIAPLDANTMAKLAHGLCDNLLTCVVRAWDTELPLLYCPAMNTAMWNHPLTDQHRQTLTELGYVEVACVLKTLVCGDTGYGAMAEVEDIVNVVNTNLNGL